MPLYEGFLNGEACPECRGIGKFRVNEGCYNRLSDCRICHGSGLVRTKEKVCPTCLGKGEESIRGRLGNLIDVPCLQCWGTGIWPKDEKTEIDLIKKTRVIFEAAYF